jgi:hypothetical protein
MPHLTGPFRAILVAITLIALPGLGCAGDTNAGPTLEFGGESYIHRWSKDHQHEFTPVAQPDLQRWTDMITVNVHPAVRDGEGLATVANTVLSNYQTHGRIVHTNSLPRTGEREAEHLMVAALGAPDFIELVFARVMKHEGVGVVLVYSHRIYGADVAEKASAWLEEQGPTVEMGLMGFAGVPSPAELEDLAR